jgi:hypothetical protein
VEARQLVVGADDLAQRTPLFAGVAAAELRDVSPARPTLALHIRFLFIGSHL